MKSHPCRWLAPLLCFALSLQMRGADYSPTLNDGITKTGDVLTYFVPLAALGTTAFLKDRDGSIELTKSVVVTMAIVGGLKYSVRSRRPNGDPYSFPSGHAAITYSSAEFLRKRYGWQYGAPAYVLATFVGYSRVRANEHHYRDMAAAAAIGIVTTHLLTTPYHGWHIQPQWTASRRGIKFSRDF